MPLNFGFQTEVFDQFQEVGLGFSHRDLTSTAPEVVQWSNTKAAAMPRFVGREPTSVLDPGGSPSPPSSYSTLSSSLGSSASGGRGGAPPPSATKQSCDGGGGGLRNFDSEFDQSMFGFILNDNSSDPSELSRLISAPSNLDSLGSIYHQSGDDFGASSGNLQESGFGFGHGSMLFGQFGKNAIPSNNVETLFNQQQQQHETIESFINHHQHHPSQNPSLYLQSEFSDQPIYHLPNPKRLNTGQVPYSENRALNPFLAQNQFQRQISMIPGGRIEEMGMHQQALLEQIFESAELVSMGNLVLAQGILARLNHQLSPLGKPFQRAAYYVKESLQLLLHIRSNNMDVNSSVATSSVLSAFSPPLSLILKLGAFKLFSEMSPVVQFANFTSNQSILEAVEMHDRIHIIDFDIGYGGQWASLIQELALRNCSGSVVSLKITAFVSSFDDFELGLTRENLSLFAQELHIDLDFKIFGFDMLNSLSQYVGNGEAVAVNLPIGVFSESTLSLPSVLRIIKQLSPKIVVSAERGCVRYDLPFAHSIIEALQSFSALLESLDAVNGNSDSLQKIERFMIQPEMEKLVLQLFGAQNKSPPWRTVLVSSGYAPLQFSNFTESQGECLVERTPVRGFHLEKKQSSLALCWQQKELISVSAWGC